MSGRLSRQIDMDNHYYYFKCETCGINVSKCFCYCVTHVFIRMELFVLNACMLVTLHAKSDLGVRVVILSKTKMLASKVGNPLDSWII